MTRPNITPGPWRQASTAQADEYTTRILAGNPARSFRVAETFAHPDADNFDEAEANAVAMTAVPDLLEALETARDLIKVARSRFPKSVKHHDTLKLCLADAVIGSALARAGYSFP
jgi:hypothetical protein